MSEQATAISGAEFPLGSYEQAAIELRRPFTAEAVKWKVQSGTLVVPYVDARLAIERLNLVCPHLWHDEYEPLAGGKGLLCRLTVDGITRIDVGEGYQGKGLFSDAFKRACVKFGIAVSIYTLPKVFLSFDDGHLKEVGKQKKSTVLTDKGRERLDSGYRAWLKETGEPMFGPVLDHGDVAGAIGDVEADQPAGPAQTELPAEPEPLTDATAKALTETAETLYGSLGKEQVKGLTKAAFKRQLAGAAHSHDELKKLILDLEKRAKP